MKQNEMSKRSLKDLKSSEKDLYGEILKLKLQVNAGSLKQNTLIRLKKRELARVKTELSCRRNTEVGG